MNQRHRPDEPSWLWGSCHSSVTSRFSIHCPFHIQPDILGHFAVARNWRMLLIISDGVVVNRKMHTQERDFRTLQETNGQFLLLPFLTDIGDRRVEEMWKPSQNLKTQWMSVSYGPLSCFMTSTLKMCQWFEACLVRRQAKQLLRCTTHRKQSALPSFWVEII